MKSFNILYYSLSILLLLYNNNVACEAKLSTRFYDRRCRDAAAIVRKSVEQAVSREPRMAASLIRLHFHDCFVQGCDASILLDQTSTIQTEKTAAPNANSVRGYDVVEAAKRAVERVCPGVVSCADVLTLAARDASVAVGGPSWNVRLGRRDSTTANRSQAENDLPGPFADLDSLISAFAFKGLNTRDMVALSGAHTIGQARCSLFRDRIYSNGTDVDGGFAAMRRRRCPRSGGDGNLAPLDLVTPDSLDNKFFNNLIERKGLLQSDQVLFGGPTASIVNEYSKKPKVFAADFGRAMTKMGEIQLLTGKNGIIRRICNASN